MARNLNNSEHVLATADAQAGPAAHAPRHIALICADAPLRRLVCAAVCARTRGWRLVICPSAQVFAGSAEVVPDVLLFHLRDDWAAAAAEIRLLKEHFQQLAVVILSSATRPELLHLVMVAGACGSVLLPARPREIARAVFRASCGMKAYCPASEQLLFGSVLPPGSDAAASAALTKTEMEFMALAKNGLRMDEIADGLRIEPRTADSHRDHILAKFGVHKLADAVRKYYGPP